jgi:hypothetical protein
LTRSPRRPPPGPSIRGHQSPSSMCPSRFHAAWRLTPSTRAI